jgi:hypothetical protein
VSPCPSVGKTKKTSNLHGLKSKNQHQSPPEIDQNKTKFSLIFKTYYFSVKIIKFARIYLKK